jgi:hypothetical protein
MAKFSGPAQISAPGTKACARLSRTIVLRARTALVVGRQGDRHAGFEIDREHVAADDSRSDELVNVDRVLDEAAPGAAASGISVRCGFESGRARFAESPKRASA